MRMIYRFALSSVSINIDRNLEKTIDNSTLKPAILLFYFGNSKASCCENLGRTEF
jgi:hypothetical protein